MQVRQRAEARGGGGPENLQPALHQARSRGVARADDIAGRSSVPASVRPSAVRDTVLCAQDRSSGQSSVASARRSAATHAVRRSMTAHGAALLRPGAQRTAASAACCALPAPSTRHTRAAAATSDSSRSCSSCSSRMSGQSCARTVSIAAWSSLPAPSATAVGQRAAQSIRRACGAPPRPPRPGTHTASR